MTHTRDAKKFILKKAENVYCQKNLSVLEL